MDISALVNLIEVFQNAVIAEQKEFFTEREIFAAKGYYAGRECYVRIEFYDLMENFLEKSVRISVRLLLLSLILHLFLLVAF